ncbi:MAG: sulfur carrier protein ThiS [Candidatus Thermoplasmatota archaeon]
MSITVNNKKLEWKEDETVKQLLKRMDYSFPLVIVKINGEIIPRKKFSETIIPDNSKVDVLHMTSGG